MRTAIATIGLLALATSTVHAGTKKAPDLSSQECGFSTPYSVQVDDQGVLLYRHDGAPKEILLHDGTLSIDRKPQPVGDADAQRLRRMEEETRALMPQVAGIARESVGITFDALATVTRMMTGSERKARKLERHRARALDDIDGSLGQGRWDQQAFDGKFEADVTEAAEEAAHSIARSALWAVFTGRADSLDKRADSMDQEMDRLVDARSEELQRHALALCAQVTALRQLQDALEYRYQGAPLAMLEVPEPAAATPAEATAKADVADDEAE